MTDPTWHLETTREFDKSMRQLDKPVALRILDALDEVVGTGDPRSRGKGLSGDLAGYWRYRIGDYRVLADIEDHRLIVIALDVGHRSRIYDR